MSDPEPVVVAEFSEVNNGGQAISLDTIDEHNSHTAIKANNESVTMNTTTSEDSEYETLEEDNGGSRSSRSSRSRRSSFSDDPEELSDDILIADEREDGDGEEENSLAKDRKLDDDEDRRNPQYIPKRGTFYEHDDRTMLDENGEECNVADPNRREKSEEGEKDVKAVGTKKGKVWVEKADKWSHDLYVEDEQLPKSTQELIDTYGYDIRNEEAPPKARRRRRYGRGPNKYTRNWEDEDAYNRAVPNQRRIYQNNKEEFPDLGETGRGGYRRRDKRQDRSQSPKKSQTLPQPPQPNVEMERRPQRERVLEDRPRNERPVRGKSRQNEGKTREERPVEKEKILKELSPVIPQPTSKPANNLPPPPLIGGIMDRQDKGEREIEQRVGRGRGFRGTGKPRPTMEFIASKGRVVLPTAFNRDPAAPAVEDSLKHAADMLIQDFSHVYINNNNNSNTNNIVEETIIPRSERRNHLQHSSTTGGGGDLQHGSEAITRPKRYSTQRQRSLPENTPPPAYSPPHNIPYYTQPPPPTSYVPAPVYNEVAPPPVTSPPMQMMAFLPPGPPPTATAAPPYPPPPILNYMPPPTFPPIALQPPMSGQFEDLTAAPELYHQSQGGITYYSTQTQSVVPRTNPPRRVKLAIPIVPPPDKPMGANTKRSSTDAKQQELQSAAS